MATTDISSDLSITLDHDCSDRIVTVTDTTDYATAGTTRADVKVNYTLNRKEMAGDVPYTLTYNEDGVTTFDVTLTKSGWHQLVMTVAQDTENVKSALTGAVTSATDASITGSGTLFTSELSDGDTIQINGELYVVGNIVSDTQLTLSSTFTGSGIGDGSIYLVPVFTGTLTSNFRENCDYQDCIADKSKVIAKNYTCGCEPISKLIEVLTLRELEARASYLFTTVQDYSSSQSIGEEMELLCDGDCCS